MSESLWSVSVDELLRRTASSDPTPGGGSIAAVSGAFGMGLVLMAIAITDDGTGSHQRGRDILDRIVPEADGDVAAFEALVEAQRERPGASLEAATIAATERPLQLAATLVEALGFAAEVEAEVKRAVVSDVLAGADLIAGAARAAIRTVDINLSGLERAGADAAAELRERRDALLAALEEAA